MPSLSDSYTKHRRIFLRLCGARRVDEWVTAKTLEEYAPISTVRTVLRRLRKSGFIERKRAQKAKGRWFYLYRASEAGLAAQEVGELPSTPHEGKGPRGPDKVIDVHVTPLTDILDTSAIEWEVLQYVIRVDDYTEQRFRTVCDPPKKGTKDRAKQVSHSEKEFAMTVSKGGKCMVSLKDHRWEGPMRAWMISAGLSVASVNNLIERVRNQLPFSMARIEIPVLEQAIQELNVRCNVRTEVRGEFVESNINYSLGKIGIEYFGMHKWVDTLVSMITALQHTTVVSEVRRDQFIADMMALLEDQRKEREAKEEGERKDKEDRWRDSLI